MKKTLILFFVLSFGLVNAQIKEEAFEDTTAHLFVIENAPFDKFQPQGNELILAMSDGGQYITFVLKRMSKEPFFLKVGELGVVEPPFFNWAKVYGMPVCKNDTISFMFEMPYRSAQYTYYFVLEKTGSKYTGVKYLHYDFQDASADAIQKAEEALAADSISYAIEWYNSVMYPQFYLNEKEVGFTLMKKAHSVAMTHYQKNEFVKASNVMRSALQYYENSLKLEYKTVEDMNEDLADSTDATWTKQKFKLWLSDYGLFLYKAGDYKGSIEINLYLNKMISYFTSPYLQLGDAYYDSFHLPEAKEAYKTYAKLMKEQKRDKLIPKRVKERIKGK